MTVTMTGWIATHTGLPSLHIVTDESVILTADGKILTRLSAGEYLLSDPLAPCGVPVAYQIGSKTITLTRPKIVGDRITTMSGRGPAGLALINNKHPGSWNSGVVQNDNGIARWSETLPLRERRMQIRVLDADKVNEVWDMLRATDHLIVTTGRPIAGIDPVQVITVSSVEPERWGLAQGETTFAVKYVQVDNPQIGLTAPVVTWEEWEAWGLQPGNPSGWQSFSEIELAQYIAGMPGGA